MNENRRWLPAVELLASINMYQLSALVSQGAALRFEEDREEIAIEVVSNFDP